jgi:adenosylcobinamide-GDP ribazoletransferase
LKQTLDHTPSGWQLTLQAFVTAVHFLTIIPFGRPGKFDARRMVPFFPLVGLFIGLLVAVVDTAAGYLWTSPVTGLLDVVALAVVTGSLHLDGLADTADGLYGRRSPERALAIMKDSRVGAIGLVVVVCCLAIKWAGIVGIAHNRLFWLLIVPAYARSAVLFGIRFLPYGRPGGGTGLAFFEHTLDFRKFWGFGFIAVLSFFSGWATIGLNLAMAVLVASTLLFYRARIGCITGDMLGALIEITEAGLFLIISAWSG